MRCSLKMTFALASLITGATLNGALAETKLKVGYTAGTDFTALFVAQENGFFRKHGLDVNPQLINLNSNIPAAIQSDSIDIGGPTLPVLLLSVDGGLDLTAISGASFSSKTATNYGFVVRPDSGIQSPKDLEGRKIGVPGLGAFLHVLFRQWLVEKGVDFKKVQFVEVPYPQMADVTRGNSVDGLVTADPVMVRMISSGSGKLMSYFHQDMQDGIASTLYAAKRGWAEKNKPTIEAFRAALDEAITFAAANPEKARADIGKYVKLPPEILAAAQIPALRTALLPADMAFWIDTMRAQGMLKRSIDPARAVQQ